MMFFFPDGPKIKTDSLFGLRPDLDGVVPDGHKLMDMLAPLGPCMSVFWLVLTPKLRLIWPLILGDVFGIILSVFWPVLEANLPYILTHFALSWVVPESANRPAQHCRFGRVLTGAKTKAALCPACYKIFA